MNQGLLQSVTTSRSRKFCSFLDGIGKNWSGKNSGYRHTMSYCPLERYVYVPPVQCIPPEPSVFHPTIKGNFLRGAFIFYEILVDLVEVIFPPTSLSPSSILFSSISLLISFSSAYSYSSTSPPGSAWVNSDRWGDEKKFHLEGDGDDTGSY